MRTLGKSARLSYLKDLVWVLLMFNVPVNNFSVMSGRSHRFLGITSTFWEVNVSCSRTQHGDLSEDRTRDLSLRSPTLIPERILYMISGHLNRLVSTDEEF